MGSKIKSLEPWQVGCLFTEKFGKKFNESVKKKFWYAPLPPEIPFALFIIGAQKLVLCLVDLELRGQLGLLTGLKIDEIGGSSHRNQILFPSFFLSDP